ncbi:hypothetical protein AB0D04_05135 [Streptomyces sp. NPDC048483]|uniref:hypothetical protein n=1 Tax=Streptomyces sp. NPDC048483 TaxID=3154927 RepID=UPI00342776EC
MRKVEYENHGVPLEDYQLTHSDHRRQKQHEVSSQSIARQVEEDLAKCRADPERAERRRVCFENAWKLMQSFKKPDHEIMRWRVRLYCGHIAETRRHREVTTLTGHSPTSMTCPECGKDPSKIVAFEPIGLAGEPPPPPEPVAAPVPPPKKPTRAQLERRVAALEKENQRLRALGHAEL